MSSAAVVIGAFRVKTGRYCFPESVLNHLLAIPSIRTTNIVLINKLIIHEQYRYIHRFY